MISCQEWERMVEKKKEWMNSGKYSPLPRDRRAKAARNLPSDFISDYDDATSSKTVDEKKKDRKKKPKKVALSPGDQDLMEEIFGNEDPARKVVNPPPPDLPYDASWMDTEIDNEQESVPRSDSVVSVSENEMRKQIQMYEKREREREREIRLLQEELQKRQEVSKRNLDQSPTSCEHSSASVLRRSSSSSSSELAMASKVKPRVKTSQPRPHMSKVRGRPYPLPTNYTLEENVLAIVKQAKCSSDIANFCLEMVFTEEELLTHSCFKGGLSKNISEREDTLPQLPEDKMNALMNANYMKFYTRSTFEGDFGKTCRGKLRTIRRRVKKAA